MKKLLLAPLLLAMVPFTGHAQHAEHEAHARHAPPAGQPQHRSEAAPPERHEHDTEHTPPPDAPHAHHPPPHVPSTDTVSSAHGDDAHAASAASHGARSPDYSGGFEPSDMPGMTMIDAESTTLVQLDRLEAWANDARHGQSWELAAWYGGDLDRLAVRSEGTRVRHAATDADIELLWSHALTPFWNTELGLRHDAITGSDGTDRDWLAFGVAGLAPYYIDLRLTAYLGEQGRHRLRLASGYDLRVTQRLILRADLEATWYGRGERAQDISRGAVRATAGLRLRYEIRPELAPYLGLSWQQRSATARQWVAGVRFWF